MNFNHYIKKAISMPPQELAKKVINKINTKIENKLQKIQDLKGSTHINFNVPIIQISYINLKELNTSDINIKVARHLSQMYCEHKFDLLGSGWVKNSYDSLALGVEGHRYNMNVSTPKSVGKDYAAIDWQKDFKSGYRWSEKVWYKDQLLEYKLGADIKVPWELARMQHLPQLAIFSLVDERLKEQHIHEFKCQILDFITYNPPRMGVNWACTMDVGIRVANILIAYDIFCQLDNFGILDDEFKQTLSNSIYEHGLHIVNNLEYSEELRSNHYLSNIAGLLYVSAYLENSDEINQWLAFSIQEVVSEMRSQFYTDGGNFESSTSYHRLSGELMIHSTALILGLKEEKLKGSENYTTKNWKIKPKLQPSIDTELPEWYIDKLYKIGRFTVDISKQNSEIPQFGDNDSGRFFRFSPNGQFITNKEAGNKYLNLNGYVANDELFWDENILNHSTFISCFAGILEDSIFQNDIGFEKSFVSTVSKKILTIKNKSYEKISIKDYTLPDLDHKKSMTHDLKSNIQNLNFIAYPNSGIYIFKADDFHLSICTTPLGQKENGGHTHNDKLGYELWISGKDIVKDPGTYLYTPLPNKRNIFRSTKAHNVPIVKDNEQNSWLEGHIGLFGLLSETKCFVRDFGDNFIELVLEYKDIKILRKFKIQEYSLEIVDMCNKKFNYGKFEMYSSGYGKIESL